MKHTLLYTVVWGVLFLFGGSNSCAAPIAPELENLRALSRFGRVDLIWDQSAPPRGAGNWQGFWYEIERRGPGEAEFRRINEDLWTTNVYSDFLAITSGEYSYRVRAILVSQDGKKTYSAWSRSVRARPRSGTPEQLLEEMQEASFRYFYHWRHPVSGLARERTPPRRVQSIDQIRSGHIRDVRHQRQLCTTGASGMGMFNLVVGVERGFITRAEGAEWALQMLRFLSTSAERYHGAFAHWLDGTTGESLPFAGPKDNAADTVETAFLASGFLLLREYFSGADPREGEIRALADRLWREIDWEWFRRGAGPEGPIYWHWSPDHGWDMDHPVRGFNESAILYVLALASPTHPIPQESYGKAWRWQNYGRERTHFDISMSLGRGMGPPLFFTHYSYLGLDPRVIGYRGETYFDHFKKFCQVQMAYAQSRSREFTGYGPLWGLTSSTSPDGYKAYHPGPLDDGTIAPTAALSSMPYVPQEGLAFLQTLYLQHGKTLWKDFGFTDAFNLTQDWVSHTLLGIDAGPIAPMIENARTGLCWKIFMRAPEIQAVLPKL